MSISWSYYVLTKPRSIKIQKSDLCSLSWTNIWKPSLYDPSPEGMRSQGSLAEWLTECYGNVDLWKLKKESFIDQNLASFIALHTWTMAKRAWLSDFPFQKFKVPECLIETACWMFQNFQKSPSFTPFPQRTRECCIRQFLYLSKTNNPSFTPVSISC